MSRFVNLVDSIIGRTNVHIIDSNFNYILKNVDFNNLPRENEIIYFGDKKYEVSKIIHNYENYRHTILIAIIPKLISVSADVTITFDKDKK